ncbi:flagellar biosynthetic protein FliR [Candidatus Fukatsuia symbiotica]|uniref:Flagellar biosynthetic protein FliR n=1 Tax=Candidatus Fukatsuia symbiotica TaxID=1878942 RepID=A0A2U8I9A8_9GAMM|nr:flagellar biosynthetic protein FliR [Candidatus Fukatsuia symbiotica]AWK14604.1 flagellar biosynthetic protein FliR [Candidatus Fukatsuia symbiotica]MEA9444910.1 flagellar biosynthetic protein FliR [Candidatus Fukatsuia symbiotica]
MEIDIKALITALFALWLPFVRILSFLHFCPLLGHKAFNRKSKLGAALLLAILITPMLNQNIILKDLLSMRALLLVAEQILWGWLFGSTLGLVFIALQTAGHILSMNMGLGMAIMNDPGSDASTVVVAQIIFVFSVLIFFTVDGHLLFISILYKGFTYWPIGDAINNFSLRSLSLSMGWIISSAVLLALPTTFIMLTVQGAFGLLNRVSPTLNLFSLGFPISMLFGLFCLVLIMTNIPDHYLHLSNEILAQLDKMKGY